MSNFTVKSAKTGIIHAIVIAALCSVSVQAMAQDKAAVPADKFDLSEWNITLPIDKDGNKKPDTITVKQIRKYSHPDFFYLDDQDRMVFASPNKAATTKNTSNTRSELRQMLRGKNTRIKTHSAKNNFAVLARKGSEKYGSIGGRMDATLHVDHVATRAGNPDTKAAYSAVVGQIHAVKYDKTSSGFGYGNEPIKIYYKKFPDQNTGSVFWTYERNLAKDDPNRTDIAYPVWGNTWKTKTDPGAAGIALGEEFSYTINVHENTMYLTFTSPNHPTVTYVHSLVRNYDGYGKLDPLDNKFSYGGDSLYFKAGIYNQCSTKKGGGTWYAGCPGTGDWAVDKANGDYAQATFSKLTVGPSTPPE
ncbi:polysaccharide lyase family 7 protein [Hellea sp.]|nr:polysaccharide lyase family 7 protein [Hellea sp.]